MAIKNDTGIKAHSPDRNETVYKVWEHELKELAKPDKPDEATTRQHGAYAVLGGGVSVILQTFVTTGPNAGYLVGALAVVAGLVGAQWAIRNNGSTNQRKQTIDNIRAAHREVQERNEPTSP